MPSTDTTDTTTDTTDTTDTTLAAAGHDGGLRPEVSALIIGYKTRDELARCLPSLYAGAEGVRLEVILVDNDSGDGTPDLVAEAFPDVELIVLDENIGFGRAVNLAASHARGEFVLLLNPDTEVLPGAVAALVACARAHPEAGLVGGRTLQEDGRPEPSSCWGRPTLWSTFCFSTGLSTALRRSSTFNPEDLPGWDRMDEREVGIITGCLLMASIDAWRSLGGFDPRFFMYGEDTDLSVRAWKAGYRPRITPDARVIHTLGASSAPTARRVMIMRGKVTLAAKHWPPRQARLMIAMFRAGVGLRAGLGRVVRTVRRGGDESQWEGTWRLRADWLGGYPPVGATAGASLAPASSVAGARPNSRS